MTQKRLKAAFAPLYLQLYDEVVPKLRYQIMPMVKHVKNMMQEMADVYELPVITSRDDVRRLSQVCMDVDVDAIVLLHMAYSPSLLVADALKELNKPLLLIDTTCDAGFEDINESYLLKNHGIHGVMDLAAVLRAKGVQYRICAGYYKDTGFVDSLSREMRILHAGSCFMRQTLGITGTPFAMMGDFAVGNAYLENKFKHRILEISEDMILAEMRHISDKDIDHAYVEETMKNQFDGDAVSLKYNIKEYLAMQNIFSQNSVSAYTMNFNDFDQTPVPFYAINKFLSQGMGYAGEGDLITASLGMPLNLLSKKATFTEFFCPDWKHDLILMSHMGEADLRFAKKGAAVELVEKTALGKNMPSYYFKFKAEPMEMTFVTWRQNPDGEAGLLCGVVDCIDHRIYDIMGVPQFVIRTKSSIRDFLLTYSVHGGGHHIYVAEGCIEDDLAAFCEVVGVDLCII